MYGSLQLVFWRQDRKPQLRDIAINFLPKFEPLPSTISLDDFKPATQPTEEYFLKFINDVNCRPAYSSKQGRDIQLTFPSGVVADFCDGLLGTIRITQRERKETTPGPLSDLREPTSEQIRDMIVESRAALKVAGERSAFVMAWAAVEAALRRAALRRGLRGQIGVQPTILISELISARVLSSKEAVLLEEARQLRNTAVHGLSPVAFPPALIHELYEIVDRILVDCSIADSPD